MKYKNNKISFNSVLSFDVITFIMGGNIMNYWLQALKLIIGLLFLTSILRVLGKQNLSQLTPYDVVYLIVFGGILDSTFYDDEIGIFPFIFSVIIWTICIYIIEMLVKRFDILRMFFRGKPECIFSHGEFNMYLVNKNKLEMEQIRMLLRKHSIFSLKGIKDIYLEIDGTLSVIKYKDYQQPVNSDLNIRLEEDCLNVLLIDNGKFEPEALKYINRSEQWLKAEMEKLGIYDISGIVYCEWSSKEGFYYKTLDGAIVTKESGHLN